MNSAAPASPLDTTAARLRALMVRAPTAVAFVAAQRFEETGLLSRLSLGPLEAFATVGYSVSSHRQPSAACQRFIEALRASV